MTRRGAGWAPTAPAVSPAGEAVGGARPSPAERLPRRGGVVEEGAPAAGEGEAAGAMWQSIGLTLLVIVATLACVLLFMLCGESRPPRCRRAGRLRRAALLSPILTLLLPPPPLSQSLVVPLRSD